MNLRYTTADENATHPPALGGERKAGRGSRSSYRPDSFSAFYPPLASVAARYVKVGSAAQRLLNTSPLSGGFLAT